MRFRQIGLLLLVLLLCGCGATTPASPAGSSAPSGQPSGTTGALTVFAAASLTEAFGEIGAEFEAANPGTTISFNFAGSQQLAQQLAQGAPADVFASANRAQMNAVIKSGQVVSGTEQLFVRNRLVVILPKDNPANIQTLEDLAKPGLKLVLVDKAVPVGQYALDFFQKASELPEYTSAYSPTVLANVVSYGENVRAVLSKIALGEGDAGIVYSSDVTGDNAENVAVIEIPDALNTIAAYPIAPTAQAPHAELARQFVAYVLSPAGQTVLQDYGFIPVASTGSS